MTREEATQRLEAWMNGEWDERRDGDVRTALSAYPDLLAEMELWAEMGALPVEAPSPALEQRLQDMLGAFRAEAGAKPANAARDGWWGWLVSVWPSQPQAAMAMAGLCLAVGLVAGWMGNDLRGGGNAAELRALREELGATRELAVLATLNQPLAADRLLGVSDAARLSGRNPLVRNALVRTLLHDSSVNVRLAALDALRGDAIQPEVRIALQQAVVAETSPLVQLELVRVLADVDHPEAQQCLADLLADQATSPAVRDEAARWLQLRL